MKRGKTDCGYFALTVNLNQKTTAQCEWAVVLLLMHICRKHRPNDEDCRQYKKNFLLHMYNA